MAHPATALKQAPSGAIDGPMGSEQAPARQAPESNQLLKQIEGNLKQAETRDAKKRRILERCGCL